jgi:hypothetical protein
MLLVQAAMGISSSFYCPWPAPWCRVLSPSKNLLVDTIRIVIDDMTWFLVFLGLTMLGFAFAFYRWARVCRRHQQGGVPLQDEALA